MPPPESLPLILTLGKSASFLFRLMYLVSSITILEKALVKNPRPSLGSGSATC